MVAQRIGFDGRVVVVTGAGNGLGRAYALELGRRGAQVVVNDLGTDLEGIGRSSAAADAVVAEIRAAGGTAVASYDTVATPEGGAAIVRTALDAFGKVDAVIHNAGIQRHLPFEQVHWEQLDAVLDTNLKAAFYVTQPAYRVMKAQGYGRFLFTSSSSGLIGNIERASYGAAKAGAFGLMNVIAIEGAQHGILANALMPNAATRMAANAPGDALAAMRRVLGDRADAMTPEFVAPLAVYLVSERCTATRRVYSACVGRYSRVFIGMCDGWLAPSGAPPSVEEIEERFGTIGDMERFSVPETQFEEFDRAARMDRGEIG
ncbi:MAG: SDR family NAD(P)-dependent oxidoreductase [Gammaproteobacteria bacterium]